MIVLACRVLQLTGSPESQDMSNYEWCSRGVKRPSVRVSLESIASIAAISYSMDHLGSLAPCSWSQITD